MEKETIGIIIQMRKDELLDVQKAANAQHKLAPDFVADAVRAVTRDCINMEQEKRGYENQRAHRHGLAEGKADAIQAAYSLLREHGHNEAADLLGSSLTTVGNPNAAAVRAATPVEKAHVEAAAAEINRERF